MNIFTNLLFRQGFLTQPHTFDPDEGYAHGYGYGNKLAAERFLAPLGHAHHAAAPAAAAEPDCDGLGACA